MVPTAHKTLARLLMFAILATSLTSCLTVPITNNNAVMLEVNAPISASDLSEAKALIDAFALRHGYENEEGKNSVGDSGDAYINTWKYTGRVRTIRAYMLTNSANHELPYQVFLSQGDDGRLFFDLILQSSSRGDAVQIFVERVASTYGQSRVHVAQPTTTEWMSIGD